MSTAEAVVAHFRSLIASGELKPGASLPSERMLQAELGISRFALREGLARLSALGLITCTQGKSSMVSGDVDHRRLGDCFTALTASPGRWTDELFATRRLIEVESAGRAAAARNAAQLRTLNGMVDGLTAMVDDGTAYARLDVAFHHAIVEVAGNRFLIAIHNLLQDQLDEVVKRTVDQRRHRTVSLAGHARILAAISARNQAAASAAMAAHLDACSSAYHG